MVKRKGRPQKAVEERKPEPQCAGQEAQVSLQPENSGDLQELGSGEELQAAQEPHEEAGAQEPELEQNSLEAQVEAALSAPGGHQERSEVEEPLPQLASQEARDKLARLERKAEAVLRVTRELQELQGRQGAPKASTFFGKLAAELPDLPWRRVKLLFCAFLFLCAALVVLCRVNIGVFNNIKDLDFRHNEITLAFERGVNSYRVFTREVEELPWWGLGPDWIEAHYAGRRVVHVYPPWHTTFFWWFGWFERGTVVKLFQWLYAVILVLNLLYLLHYRPRSVVGNLTFLFAIVGGCFTAGACCYDALNYGILFMPALVVYYEAFKHSRAAVFPGLPKGEPRGHSPRLRRGLGGNAAGRRAASQNPPPTAGGLRPCACAHDGEAAGGGALLFPAALREAVFGGWGGALDALFGLALARAPFWRVAVRAREADCGGGEHP